MATTSRKIFVDTSVLVSFIDRADSNHQKGVQAIESIAKLGYQAYTSNQNISETYALLAQKVGVSVALDFLQIILQSDIEIIFSQRSDLITAHRIIRANRDKQVSFREALNATLMQKRGIMQVLTLNYWHNLFGTYVSQLIVVKYP